MISCKHCESLIPTYYNTCPVCGQVLDKSNKVRFKTFKHSPTKKSNPLENIDTKEYTFKELDKIVTTSK